MLTDIARATEHFRAGDFNEARKLCHKLLTRNSRDPEAQQLLGALDLKAGRHESAIQLLRTADSLRPGQPAIHNNLGLAHEYLGNLGEAEYFFRSAIEIDVHFVAAYFNLSEVTRLSLGDPQAQQMMKIYSGIDNLSVGDRASICFAVGKVFADNQCFDQAFRAFLLANEAARPDYDQAAYTRHVDRTIATFTSDLLARLSAEGDPSTLPIFLVGMPRTGSTLVEQILSSHPAVRGLGELPWIPNIAANLSPHSSSDGGYPECVDGLPGKALQGFSGSYLSQVWQSAPGAERTVDKQLGNFAYVGLINLLFPQAKIVHVYRDPFDTCLSCFFRRLGHGGEFSYSLDDLGQYYLDYRRLIDHWSQVCASPLHHLEYERLVNDQEAVTRELLDYCGLDWHPDCLQFHRTQRSVSTSSASQVRQPIYRSAIRRWHSYRKHLQPLIEILEGGN